MRALNRATWTSGDPLSVAVRPCAWTISRLRTAARGIRSLLFPFSFFNQTGRLSEEAWPVKRGQTPRAAGIKVARNPQNSGAAEIPPALWDCPDLISYM